MGLSRRRVLSLLPAALTTALCLPYREAKAFPWLVAAQLAITAVGLFTKSDGGLGAYLGALKQLSEENIRLTQEVLKQVAEVQKQIAQMPSIIAEAFITNNEYLIREQLQEALDAMRLISNPKKPSLADIARLEKIIEICSSLAAKRNLPYGKRGVAASCAPLAAALDIHARKLLGRDSEIPIALRVLYIDWMNLVLDV